MTVLFPRTNEQWEAYTEALVRQHHTDIQRIWSRLQQPSQAVPANDPSIPVDPLGAGGGGGEGSSTGILAKTSAAVAKGASGTFAVHAGVPGSETPTGDNITAFNKFGDLDADVFVWISSTEEGHNYVIMGEC